MLRTNVRKIGHGVGAATECVERVVGRACRLPLRRAGLVSLRYGQRATHPNTRACPSTEASRQGGTPPRQEAQSRCHSPRRAETATGAEDRAVARQRRFAEQAFDQVDGDGAAGRRDRPLLGGRRAARSGDCKRPVLPGLAVDALALAAMGALAPRLDALGLSARLALVAFGIGPRTAAVDALAQHAAPARQLGMLTGAMALSRAPGAAIVVAAGSALIVAQVRRGGGALAGGLERATAQALDPAARAVLRGAYAERLYAAAAGIALALLCSAGIRPRSARIAGAGKAPVP